MNIKSKVYILKFVFSFSLIFFMAGNLSGETYSALKGVENVKAVFDVRLSNPKVAAIHLDLVHKTFTDNNIQALPGTADFVVVFMGPAVKLISTNREGYAPEDRKSLDAIAKTITKMARDGIKLEICIFAANLLGVAADSILPEIKQVENGWVSSIGYQLKGYALVPDF